jgi:hypothetical protein
MFFLLSRFMLGVGGLVAMSGPPTAEESRFLDRVAAAAFERMKERGVYDPV